MNGAFGFRMCWTCRHLVLDIEDGNRKPACDIDGRRMSRRESVTPTECEHWQGDTEHISKI